MGGLETLASQLLNPSLWEGGCAPSEHPITPHQLGFKSFLWLEDPLQGESPHGPSLPPSGTPSSGAPNSQ